MGIKKRLFALGSAVSLAVALGGFVAPAAHAAPPAPHDASNDSVTCNDLLGKIKFSTPLSLLGPTTGANQITLTIKSDDCQDTTAGVYDPSTNPTGVSLKSGSAKGILNSTTGSNCLGLQGLSTGTTGAVPMKWATNPGTPKLTNSASTLTVNQTWGGTYNDGGVSSPAAASDSWGSQYGFFAFGNAASGLPKGSAQQNTIAPDVSGSFTGGDSGHTSQFQGATAQSIGSILIQCSNPKPGTGVKGITFSIGGFTLK